MLELILFISLGILVVILLSLRDRKTQKEAEKAEDTSQEATVSTPTSATAEKEDTGECCGQHLVCERDTLLNTRADIEYYDDEELDILAGISPDEYTEENIQMLQDVFYTLREADVAGWVRSLQVRNIELPTELREEALLIVRERRAKTTELYNATHPENE